MNDQNTTEAQLAMAMEAFKKDVGTIVDLGRSEYGEEGFDTMSQIVGEAIGGIEKVAPFMAAVRECDAPVAVIRHLSENPDLAAKIGGMSDARRLAALARVEAQLLPHANGTSTGADPAWRGQARRGGRVDITSPASDSASDEAWYAAWCRRYKHGKD
jgi:hypothetical protein